MHFCEFFQILLYFCQYFIQLILKFSTLATFYSSTMTTDRFVATWLILTKGLQVYFGQLGSSWTKIDSFILAFFRLFFGWTVCVIDTFARATIQIQIRWTNAQILTLIRTHYIVMNAITR